MTKYVWKGLTGDWTAQADWNPAGTPGADDTATIAAAGSCTVEIATMESISVAGLTLDQAGATLAVAGLLSVHGTLALDAGTLMLTGTIADTTIRDDGGTFVGANDTLDNVTYQGPLDIGGNSPVPGYDAAVTIADHFTITSLPATDGATEPGMINLNGPQYSDGDAAFLQFASSATTLDDVTINILSNPAITDSENTADLAFAAATLTFGSGVTLDAQSGFYLEAENQGTLVNDGTIEVVGNNGFGLIGDGLLVNAGSIDVADAALGDNSSFQNSGVITVGSGGYLYTYGSIDNTGTITVMAGGTLVAPVAGSGTLVALSRSTIEAGFGNVIAPGYGVGQDISLDGTLINFVAAYGTLALHGFISSDRIDLQNFGVFNSPISVSGTTVTVDGEEDGADFVVNLFKIAPNQGFVIVPDARFGAALVTASITNGPAGGHATITVGDTNAIILASGYGNLITMAVGDGLIRTGGGGAVVTTGVGEVVVQLGGSDNHVITAVGLVAVEGSATASTIMLHEAADQVMMTGNNDTIVGGSTVTLTGNGNVIHSVGDSIDDITGNDNVLRTGSGGDSYVVIGNDNTINLAGSYYDTGFGNDDRVVGSGNTVTLAGRGDTLYVAGSLNAIFLAAASFATVLDAGAGLAVVAGPGAQSNSISGVASDAAFVLDLVGGVGGFTTASQAYAALQSDGSGGSILHLGAGSVDLLGVSKADLGVRNFAVLAAYPHA